MKRKYDRNNSARTGVYDVRKVANDIFGLPGRSTNSNGSSMHADYLHSGPEILRHPEDDDFINVMITALVNALTHAENLRSNDKLVVVHDSGALTKVYNSRRGL